MNTNPLTKRSFLRTILGAAILAPLFGRKATRAPDEDKCNWPGCCAPAMCSSGSFGGLLVCRDHFKITNGPGERAHEIHITFSPEQMQELQEHSRRLCEETIRKHVRLNGKPLSV